MFLARTRLGAKPGVVRPRTHLVLRVSENGASWHAAVGFGARGILDPIPFRPGRTQEQSGFGFRIVEDGPELVLQKLAGDEWVDAYGFHPQPVPLIDVETSNWWTCTNPGSLFVTGLIVGVRRDDGTGTLLSDWSELSLGEETPAGTSVTPLEPDAIPELLATRFSLPGFALGADDRLVRVGAAP
jgi:N-hydroxyarylamine O-acetyltransferase